MCKVADARAVNHIARKLGINDRGLGFSYSQKRNRDLLIVLHQGLIVGKEYKN